jgi:signal transduction histidine kinase
MQVQNSVALVTGANRSIGKAFVEVLIEAGARRVYATARNMDSLRNIVTIAPDRIVAIALDVTQPHQIAAIVRQTPDVNLLINNAGVAGTGGLFTSDSLDTAEWEMQTNYFGTLRMMQAFAPLLKQNQGGAIVNVLSIVSVVNIPVFASYSASKAALNSITQAARAELAIQGTQVVGVFPVTVDTDMSVGTPLDKVAPSRVAQLALQAVESGVEDVYPDPVAEQVFLFWDYPTMFEQNPPRENLSQEELIERERLAAIGELTAMIVHEVRNPLTTIELGLRHAKKVLHTDADLQRITLALSESQRLNQLLSEILGYAKPKPLNCSIINVNEFLQTMLAQIQDLPEAIDRSIYYVNEVPTIEIMADVNKLKQVFLNLFRNALEAIATQETVSCLVNNSVPANSICISIRNAGKPIPPELLPQIGTPFCSTKPNGTGLGLAISKQIITAHGGALEILSFSTETIVSIHLPIASYSNPG